MLSRYICKISLGEGEEGQLGNGFQINQLRVWSWLANLVHRSSSYYHQFKLVKKSNQPDPQGHQHDIVVSFSFSRRNFHLSFLQNVPDIVHRHHLRECHVQYTTHQVVILSGINLDFSMSHPEFKSSSFHCVFTPSFVLRLL